MQVEITQAKRKKDDADLWIVSIDGKRILFLDYDPTEVLEQIIKDIKEIK